MRAHFTLNLKAFLLYVLMPSVSCQMSSVKRETQTSNVKMSDVKCEVSNIKCENAKCQVSAVKYQTWNTNGKCQNVRCLINVKRHTYTNQTTYVVYCQNYRLQKGLVNSKWASQSSTIQERCTTHQKFELNYSSKLQWNWLHSTHTLML